MASAVVVHVAESAELSAGQEAAMLTELTDALRDASGAPVRVGGARGCAQPPECAGELSEHAPGDAVVVVHFFAGLEHVQVLLRRVEAGAVINSTELVVTPRAEDREAWRRAARLLFAPLAVIEATTAPHSAETSFWPWVAASSGAAAVALGVSLGFAVHRASLAEQVRGTVDDELLDGARAHDTATSAMWVSAGVGAGFALLGGLLAVLSD